MLDIGKIEEKDITDIAQRQAHRVVFVWSGVARKVGANCSIEVRCQMVEEELERVTVVGSSLVREIGPHEAHGPRLDPGERRKGECAEDPLKRLSFCSRAGQRPRPSLDRHSG
jgi:hypothetical protein